MQFHLCSKPCHSCDGTRVSGVAALSSTQAAVPNAGGKDFTVDVHCHVLVPEVETLVADRPEKKAERQLAITTQGSASAHHNFHVMTPSVYPKLIGEQERLADMDTMGIDIQLISPSPTQYYYWADEDLATRIVEVQNRNIAALCARHPDRLIGLGNVALQHPTLAARQLRHAVEVLGLKGVEISSTVSGKELSHPELNIFWETAHELQCIVFLHPLGTSAYNRLDSYYLTNAIGQPFETTVALSHLIFSGTLDRYPGSRLIAAHGGGYLPAYFGRTEHAWKVRPEAGHLKQAPSAYLRQIWFDTVVHEPQVLRHLINVVGVSQVLAGTDYPYDMGHYPVHELLASVEALTAQDKRRILGLNAAKLLDIEPVPTRKP